MNKLNLKVFFAIITLMLMAFTCTKEEAGPLEPETHGAVSGTVKEFGTNILLENARIYSQPATDVVLTGEYGSFRINKVNPGNYTIYCVKMGYDTLKANIAVIAGATAKADFILQKKDSIEANKYGRIIGVVRDSKDEAVLKNVLLKTTPATSQVITNDKGEFSFEKVLPGAYKIIATKNGYENIEISVNILAGQTTSAQIYLSSIEIISGINNGIISGKITDGIDNSPLVGVIISTTPSASSVTTDANGLFRIEKLAPGEYTVNATKTGYTATSIKVLVKTGLTTTADLVLNKSTGSIRGTVVGIDNYPISGVQIRTEPGTSVVTTNANGEFSLDNIAPGKFKLIATKTDFIEFNTEIVITAGNITRTDFVMRLVGSN